MDDIKEKLRKIPQLSDRKEEDLDWLISKSEIREANVGEALFKSGDPVSHMRLVLEGKISFMVNQNGNYFEAGSVNGYEWQHNYKQKMPKYKRIYLFSKINY